MRYSRPYSNFSVVVSLPCDLVALTCRRVCRTTAALALCTRGVVDDDLVCVDIEEELVDDESADAEDGDSFAWSGDKLREAGVTYPPVDPSLSSRAA